MRKNYDGLRITTLFQKFSTNVIPAKAGIHALLQRWIPAFAGMTELLITFETM